MRKIRNKAKSYIGVLSFLLLNDYWGRVSFFMKKGYTDQILSNFDSISVATDQKQPISSDEIKDMLSVKLGLGPKACKDFFSFFMPSFTYGMQPIVRESDTSQETWEPRKINSSQILPFDIDKPMGEGGFSTAYKAKIPEKYHNYKIAKVCNSFGCPYLIRC